MGNLRLCNGFVCLHVHAFAWFDRLEIKPAATSEMELFIIAPRASVYSRFEISVPLAIFLRKILWSAFPLFATLNPIKGEANRNVCLSDFLFFRIIYLVKQTNFADDSLGRVFLRMLRNGVGGMLYDIIFPNHDIQSCEKSINDWICAHRPSSSPESRQRSQNQIKLKHNNIDEGRWSHHGKDCRRMIKKIKKIPKLNLNAHARHLLIGSAI